MGRPRMIEVRESLDAEGWYLVQGGGKAASTLADLAKLLGVPQSELAFRPRMLDKKPRPQNLNNPDLIARRSDFDAFDP